MNSKLGIQDLASAFSERYGMDQKSSAAFVKAVFDIVEEYVAIDKLVKIKGFGTFKLISVSDRESVNVNTGERIVIAGHTKLTFTPEASLKDAVNRPFSDFETTPLNETTSIEEMEKIPVQEDDDPADGMSEPEPSQSFLEVIEETVIEETGLQHTDAVADLPELAVAASDAGTYEEQEEHQIRASDATAKEDDAALSSGDGKPAAADNAIISPEAPESKNNIDGSSADTPEARPYERKPNEENPSYPMSDEPMDMPVVDGKCKKRGWLFVLMAVILMALSYMAGYYRVLDMIDFSMYPETTETERTVETDSTPEEPADNPVAEVHDSIANNDTVQTDTLDALQVPAANKQQTDSQEDPAEIAKYFPQVPGGDYWIVGDAGYVHHMQVGETLYRIARKELGDQNLVRYLIVFNKFEDPNIIHTGDPIRIPKLVKKDIQAN